MQQYCSTQFFQTRRLLLRGPYLHFIPITTESRSCVPGISTSRVLIIHRKEGTTLRPPTPTPPLELAEVDRIRRRHAKNVILLGRAHRVAGDTNKDRLILSPEKKCSLCLCRTRQQVFHRHKGNKDTFLGQPRLSRLNEGASKLNTSYKIFEHLFLRTFLCRSYYPSNVA